MKKIPKVLLSAGHWSEDRGAGFHDYGRERPIYEHDITTKAVMYVLGEMWYDTPSLASNIIVVPQAPLQEKIAFVNKWSKRFAHDPHFAVELHCNAGPPGARGIEGFYYPGNGVGKEILQTIILATRLSVSELPDRGVKDTDEFGSRLAWVHDTLPTSVLVELGFLTNDEDRGILCEDRRLARLCRGVASGLTSAMLVVRRLS